MNDQHGIRLYAGRYALLAGLVVLTGCAATPPVTVQAPPPPAVAATPAPQPQTVAGCWLDVYVGNDYSGRSVRINGPVDLPNLRNYNGAPWNNVINSLAVGPHANVWLFKNEDFNAPTISMGPGQRIGRLSELHWDNEIDSVKVRCSS